MPEARAAADARMVLRVKRKRQDDPVDAFRFEHRDADSFTKRRQTNERASLLTDIFHFAETQTEADVSGTHRIIDAEWDASKRLISLKRKHDDRDDVPVQRRRTDLAMNQFAGMLSEYLQRTCTVDQSTKKTWLSHQRKLPLISVASPLRTTFMTYITATSQSSHRSNQVHFRFLQSELHL